MNTKNISKSTKAPRSVGRPSFKITYPRGAFTINQLFELNKTTVKWPLTVRQHVEKQIAGGFLTLLDSTVKTGKVGKPAFRYIRTAVAKSIEARKATKASGPVGPGVVEAPTVVAETAIPLTEVPAESLPAVVAEPVSAELVTA